MRRCIGALAALGLVGCSLFEEPPPPPPTRPPPPPPPAPIAAARPTATRASFDLVSGAPGTFLVWGVRAADGAGVRLIELGPGGAARGTDRELATGGLAAPAAAEQAPSQTAELAAAIAGDHLAVAWTVHVAGTMHTEAVYAATTPQFAAPTDLGELELGPTGRGNVMVSALSDGALYVAHRIMPGACHDTSGGATQCTRFARTRVPSGDDLRSDGASEIASPCMPLLAGAVGGANGEPFYYGVCHGPVTATTLFVINPDPARQYAAATEVLAGCTPRGIARADGGAVVRAVCGDDEAFAHVDGMGRTTRVLRHATLTTRCDAGRPVLEARDGDQAVVRRLTESESRIEAWLPGTIAPEGSRAVWTGEALLVATPIGPEGSREVALRRYECVDADLQRTDDR